MKKVISILLVAMLIIGMFPATALTAFAAGDTYELVNVGDLNTDDIVIITMKVNSSGNTYAVSNNNGTSKAPTAVSVTPSNNTITAPVATILWKVKKNSTGFVFLSNSDTSTWLYSTSTNNGTRVGTNADDTFALDSASGYLKHLGTNRYLGVYNEQDWRCYNNTTGNTANQVLGIYRLSTGGTTEPDVPPCEHTNFEMQNAFDATCTTNGYTGDKYCLDCKEVVEEGEVIPAGHKYVDGECENCGEPEPEGYTLVTSVSDLETGDQVVIVANAGDTNYALGNKIGKKIPGEKVTVSGSTVAATDESIWTAEIVDGKVALRSGSNYLKYDSGTDFASTDSSYMWNVTAGETANTFVFTSSDAGRGIVFRAKTYNQFGGYALSNATAISTEYFKELQMYKLSSGSSGDIEEPECTHEGATIEQNAKAADCLNPGKEADIFCTACEKTISTGKEIPAQGHKYVDGICERCGEAEPVATVVGRYYIAAIRKEGNYFYMTSNVNDKSRYVAVDSGLTVLPESIDEAEAATNQVFALIDNGDSTYSLRAEGVEGDNYLGWNSDNTGTLVAADKALDLTVTITDGIYQISFQGDAERYLSLNATANNDYFAWYKTGQKKELNLIPVVEAEAEPVINGYVDGTWKEFTSVDEALTASNGKLQLIDDIDSIDYDGELYLDLNGKTADTVTATKIYAYDSTASAAAAGTGSITTSSEVVMDNTVNGVRYIALEDNGTYTFHVLEMKLSAVTLRANEQCGIYYKATYACDEQLAAAIDSYGVVFSVKNMPGADFMTETGDRNLYTAYDKESFESNKQVTSGSIFGIMKEDLNNNAERGRMKIYANAYIIIDGVNDGKPLMADTANAGTTWKEGYTGVAYSLFDVMDKLDEKWTDLTDAQRTTIRKFYDDWASKGMSDWKDELPNIAD